MEAGASAASATVPQVLHSSSGGGPEHIPKLAFNTHRFVWWLSGYDLDELLHNEESRRLTSRKFRTRINHRFPAGRDPAVRHCYWRMSIQMPPGNECPRIRLQCSAHHGVDALCFIRFFSKHGESFVGSFFKFGEAGRGNDMEFDLSRHLTRELDRQSRRKKSETLAELILVILSDYDDGTKQKLTAQIRNSDASIGSGSAETSANSSPVNGAGRGLGCAVPLGGFVQNARKAFESITQKDGNHFSDVTLAVAISPEDMEEGKREEGDSWAQPPHEDNNKKKDTVKFYCHRYLLAQGSPVFAAMFSSGDGSYSENQNREVYVDDVRPEVMREFLHFLYTGTLDKPQPVPHGEFPGYKDLVLEIIHLAEKYQVKHMVEDLVRAHTYRLYRLKGVLIRLVAWHSDELLTGDAGLPEPSASSVPASGDVQERNRLLQANPALHMELTQYLAMVTHHGCEQLELDSLSDNDSSAASSLSTCTSDSSCASQNL